MFKPDGYEDYMVNIKSEQEFVLLYILPQDHISDDKTRIFNEVGIDNLKKNDASQLRK